MSLKLLNNIGNSGHRNIKLFGDGLVTFALTMLSYYLFSNVFSNVFSMFSVIHTVAQNSRVSNFLLLNQGSQTQITWGLLEAESG